MTIVSFLIYSRIVLYRYRERQRRYRIMREHGLLLPNHTRSWMGKVADAMCIQNGKSTTSGRFVAFMQLTTGLAFDRVVEARQYEHDLRKFIFKWVSYQSWHSSIRVNPSFSITNDSIFVSSFPRRLYELRSNGITTFEGARVFQKLRARRTSKMRAKPTNTWEWKQLVPNNRASSGSAQIIQHCIDLNTLPMKRKSTPLNILGRFCRVCGLIASQHFALNEFDSQTVFYLQFCRASQLR